DDLEELVHHHDEGVEQQPQHRRPESLREDVAAEPLHPLGMIAKTPEERREEAGGKGLWDRGEGQEGALSTSLHNISYLTLIRAHSNRRPPPNTFLLSLPLGGTPTQTRAARRCLPGVYGVNTHDAFGLGLSGLKVGILNESLHRDEDGVGHRL